MQKDNTPPFVHWATKGRNLVSFLLGGKLLKKIIKRQLSGGSVTKNAVGGLRSKLNSKMAVLPTQILLVVWFNIVRHKTKTTEQFILNHQNIAEKFFRIKTKRKKYAKPLRQEQFFSHPNIWRNVAEC
jgi:hypothetical protein